MNKNIFVWELFLFLTWCHHFIISDGTFVGRNVGLRLLDLSHNCIMAIDDEAMAGIMYNTYYILKIVCDESLEWSIFLRDKLKHDHFNLCTLKIPCFRETLSSEKTTGTLIPTPHY